MLAAIRSHSGDLPLHVDWAGFAAEKRGLLLWEAFVSANAKGASHVDDATIAVAAFKGALPDPTIASTITAERPLSLAGAIALCSGWLETPAALHQVPLVIRA